MVPPRGTRTKQPQKPLWLEKPPEIFSKLTLVTTSLLWRFLKGVGDVFMQGTKGSVRTVDYHDDRALSMTRGECGEAANGHATFPLSLLGFCRETLLIFCFPSLRSCLSQKPCGTLYVRFGASAFAVDFVCRSHSLPGEKDYKYQQSTVGLTTTELTSNNMGTQISI
jgi:hypothetical protein